MKAKRKMPKSPGPRSPKLAALETEIMEQHIQGKKIAAIQKWLKTEKKISIAYSNLYNFIHRRAEKFSETSGTAVILHFMRLKPEIREEVLQILQMLMHKGNDIPIQKSIRKQKPVAPAATEKPVSAVNLQIHNRAENCGDRCRAHSAVLRLQRLSVFLNIIQQRLQILCVDEQQSVIVRDFERNDQNRGLQIVQIQNTG